MSEILICSTSNRESLGSVIISSTISIGNNNRFFIFQNLRPQGESEIIFGFWVWDSNARFVILDTSSTKRNRFGINAIICLSCIRPSPSVCQFSRHFGDFLHNLDTRECFHSSDGFRDGRERTSLCIPSRMKKLFFALSPYPTLHPSSRVARLHRSNLP